MKRKTNNKILLLLLALLMVVTIIGCTNKKETSSKTESIENIDAVKDEKEEVIEEKIPETFTANLVAVGDNLIHTTIIKAGKQDTGYYNFDSLYVNIREELESADIKVINQETMLVSEPKNYTGYPCFGSPYAIGDAIRNAGFNVVTHATNHSYDKRETGIMDTTNYWKQYPEVLVTGVYQSQEDYDTITIGEFNHIKVAFLNYTYGLNGFVLPSDKQYYVNTLYDENKIISDLQRANELADIVVVLPHWGNEYVYKPSEQQRYLAQLFVDNGADLIIGTHPHVLQPLEYISKPDGNQVPCFYSLGNFTSSQTEMPRMLGGMAKVTITKTEGEDAKILTSVMEPTVTYIASDCGYFTTYMLSDYTNELAKSHYLTRKGKNMTIEKISELFNSIYTEN